MSTPLPPAAGRRAELLGGLIGAVAGVAFVVLNAGVLGDLLALVVRIVGVLTGVLLAGSAVRRMRAASAAGGSARGGFSRGYWWIVLAEVVALLAGVRVLDAAFDRAYLGVASVAIVVGVHFFGLGRLWHAAPARVGGGDDRARAGRPGPGLGPRQRDGRWGRVGGGAVRRVVVQHRPIRVPLSRITLEGG